ncbi:MAG: TonB-dependent receptor plug domain-containing protein, partial [Burkholderiaceae bacterium]
MRSFAAALTILANAAAAQSAMQSVDVTGHYQNGVGTSEAASEGTVRGERLADLPLLRPGEVLETVPGLVVTQHSGDGKANQYFLRGYNLDHGTDFATQVDGLPINLPTNAHGQGYADLNFLIPELVEKIDYRKGPYFAEDGDFSSAGSARIRYRDRLEGGLLKLTAGSDGYRRLLLAGSTALPAPAGGGSPGAPSASGPRILGAFEAQRDDGPWTTPEGVRKWNALLKLSDGDRDRGWSATALGYANRWTSTDQVPLELIRSGRLGRYAALDPTDGGASAWAAVTGEWHAHDDRGYTTLSAYAQHDQLTLWSNFTYFEADPVRGDQFEQKETRNLVGGQAVHGCSTPGSARSRRPSSACRRATTTSMWACSIPKPACRSRPSATTTSAKPPGASTCRTPPPGCPGCPGCAACWACAATASSWTSAACARPPAATPAAARCRPSCRWCSGRGRRPSSSPTRAAA